ncbi:MAG TPA: TonB-dependent receptor [Candidatus Xenobia bacterium]|nr:TonB-dependent receptor [Candidatus Xenobia bacterium]
MASLSSPRLFGRWLMVLCVVLAISAPVLAQLGTGSIEGAVLDPTGAVLPDAQVTVRNTATGVERVLTTDAAGRYRAVALEPGTYSVKASKSGFKTGEHTGIQVTVGSTTTVDISLQVGAATETIEVTEAPPAIDTEKTDVTSTVDNTVVSNVPVIGRRFDNYVLLTPGVSPDGTFGLITYRGISGLYNNNTVDGTDNNQAFFSEARGRTRAVYTYSQATVKEFQVGLSNFNAEYGRAAGGLVNAVTKSGTNEFHGEAFYFIRDDITSAREPTIPVNVIENAVGKDKLPERRQQFGFAMGGPFVKDKLFWFLAWDQQVRNFPYVVNFNSVNFITVGGVPVQDASGCSGLATVNQRATCQFFFAERTVVPRKALNEVGFFRVDWTLNANNNLGASYNFHQWRSVNGIRTPLINFNAASDNGFDNVRTDSVVLRLNTIFNPTLLNELRFQFGKDNELQRPNAKGPGTSVTGGFSFGQPNFLPRPQFPFETRLQWVDNITWIRGRHSFKVGADINYVRENQINLFQGGGVYSYSNFNNLAGDCPPGAIPFGCVPDGVPSYGSFTQAFDLRPGVRPGSIFFTTTDWNWYVQDTFRMNSQLTINYGIRYEYQQLPQPQNGNPNFPLTQHFNQDRNNWGPRLGIAWDVGGRHKTIVRAGYGLIYGRTSNSALSSAQTDNGVVNATFVFFPTTDIDPVTPGTQPVIYPNCFAPGVNADCSLALVGSSQRPDIRQFSEDFARPMVHQAEFTLEHEVIKDTVVSGTYAFSGGRRLPFFRDLNMPPAGNVFFINLPADLVINGETLAPAGVYGPLPFYCIPDSAPAPTNRQCPVAGTFASTGRPIDGIRRLLQAESVVNSSYHGLILRASRRMNRGIQFDTHFTWSHAIDNGQNSLTFFGSSTTAFDPFNQNLDRSRSDFDRRWRWVSTFVWQPEGTFDMQGTKKKVLGGWTFSGVYTWQDGLPLTPFLSGFLSSTCNVANPCPIDTGNSNGSGGTFRFPFLGRNTFEGQNFSNFDFRIARSFRIGERYEIQGIVESFNLFNHSNFVSYDTTAFSISSAAKNVATCGSGDAPVTPITVGNRCINVSPASGFLTPRAASSTLNNPREFQFAVRFRW